MPICVSTFFLEGLENSDQTPWLIRAMAKELKNSRKVLAAIRKRDGEIKGLSISTIDKANGTKLEVNFRRHSKREFKFKQKKHISVSD